MWAREGTCVRVTASRGASPGLLTSRPVCSLIRASLSLPSGLWSLVASPCPELPGVRRAGNHQSQGVPWAVERASLTELLLSAPTSGVRSCAWSVTPGRSLQKLPERSETTSYHRLGAHAALNLGNDGKTLHVLREVWLHQHCRRTLGEKRWWRKDRQGWTPLTWRRRPVLMGVGGFPGGSNGRESVCNVGKPGLDPWVRKIPWRRAWQPTPVFLPGESRGQRSLVGYSPWGRKKSDWKTNTHTQVPGRELGTQDPPFWKSVRQQHSSEWRRKRKELVWMGV